MRKTTLCDDSGSAYIVTFLVLLVVTLLGLILSLVTQTESIIGHNERITNRVFYAADTGIGVATSDALMGGGYAARSVTVAEPIRALGHKMANQVAITPFVPILVEPCNWCPLNEGKKQFFKVNHAVTVDATRFGWTGTSTTIAPDAVPQARETVATMIEFQPWWEPPTDAIADPSQLAKVRY